MTRRGLTLPILAVALLGGTLAVASAASASLPVYPGVRLVGRTPSGGYADAGTDAGQITRDGRFVTFSSAADDLVAGDTDGQGDAFIRDLDTGEVARVSDTDEAAWPLSVSANGSVVTWRTSRAAYVTDRATGAVQQVGTGATGAGAWTSQDGQIVLVAESRPLAPPDYRTRSDLFALDRRTGARTAVDARPDGTPSVGGSDAPVLSADGTTVLFLTDDPVLAPGLAHGARAVMRRRLPDGPLEVLATSTARVEWIAGADDHGDLVAVTDRLLTPTGEVTVPGINAVTTDGRFVSHYRDPDGDGISSLYRLEVATGEDVPVTPASGRTLSPQLSADGSTAVYLSDAVLVPGTAAGLHGYRQDVATGAIDLVCCDLASPFRTAEYPVTDLHGDRVLFQSQNTLDQDDHNDAPDAFVWDPPTVRVTVDPVTGTEGQGPLAVPVHLAAPATTDIELRWEVQDWWGDVVTDAGTIVVPAGTTDASVPLALVDDDVPEPAHGLLLRVALADRAPAGHPDGTVTVLDDDAPPTISVADTHAAEDHGPMTWTLSLDHAARWPVTVHWSAFQDTSAPSERQAAADKDFTPASGTVTFAPGQTVATVSATVLDDLFFEHDEWFVVELTAPSGAGLGRAKATGTINDDESAGLWSITRSLAAVLL